VPSPDTPATDIARATAAGTLAATLSDAADRILQALA
jgi:hypothetical protein